MAVNLDDGLDGLGMSTADLGGVNDLFSGWLESEVEIHHDRTDMPVALSKVEVFSTIEGDTISLEEFRALRALDVESAVRRAEASVSVLCPLSDAT
jgi:hypothetical protein